jgi:hypothetical protein
MKKIIAILIAIAMCATFAPMVGATPTQNISVKLNPSSAADITVNQTTWTPVAGLGAVNSTAENWASITNNGLTNVSVTVHATNTTDWTLAGTAAHNAFKLETTGIEKTLTTEEQAFVEDLPTIAGDPTETFGLKVTMPTTSSNNAEQTTTITFTATVK